MVDRQPADTAAFWHDAGAGSLGRLKQTGGPEMNHRLGILVNTDRHPDYVLQLARAARERGKAVFVHFTGAGLRLADGAFLEALAGLAALSADEKKARPDALSCLGLSDFFSGCDRCVVF